MASKMTHEMRAEIADVILTCPAIFGPADI